MRLFETSRLDSAFMESLLPYFLAGRAVATNPFTTNGMKKEGQNQPGERNYGAGIGAPRFNEETKAAARPVVPLVRVNGSDSHPRNSHTRSRRVRRAIILNARNRWIQSMLVTLALGVVVVVVVIALFDNNEKNVSSASLQTTGGTASVMGALPATQILVQARRVDASDDPAKALRVSDSRSSLPVRYETRPDDWNEVEGRVHDEDKRDEDDKEKLAERARKEEKKRVERRRKEAEKLAERRRESQERGETRPRLVGIYTEKP